MHNNSFFKTLLLLVSIFLFISCDKEYSEIGDALIGENNFDLSKENYNVVAYNQKITPIQSDNLAINALGIYDNPAFGKTIANFATQLTLASVNPTINLALNPVIDSVYIDVPYFVDASQTKPITNTTTGLTAGNTYVLDSIYGEPNAKIKLSVFESGYLMNDLDPANGFQSSQKYYTNQNADFETLKIGNRLNDDASTAQNDAFFFDSKQNTLITKDATGKETSRTYSAPSMRLKLNKAFFESKILNAPPGKLATNDVFKEYFRGLYFKVEQSGADPGSLCLINFAKGTITIKYKENTSSTDSARLDKTIVLNLSGNTVSLLNQSNTNLDYSNATSNANPILGDEKLYLKGGEGSLAIIELFGSPDSYKYDLLVNASGKPIDENGNVIPLESNGNPKTGYFLTYTKNNTSNGIPDKLDDIRFPLIDDSPGQIYHSIKKRWLINEANLVFHIDAAAMANSYEPNRIYLYDFTNSLPVLDYLVDGSSAVKPKRAKLLFDGNINKDATTKRGSTYKIRITNHLRNLVNNIDTKNVQLGLVVTEDIAIANFNFLRTATVIPAFSVAPRASVMNPLGTILYGSKSSSNATDEEKSKRLKLEIYYTKPN